MPTLNVNGRALAHDAEPATPLLWVLREQLGLTGTKYGCGIARCGACTVHIAGAATRTCVRPVSPVGADEPIITIEGLSPEINCWVVVQADDTVVIRIARSEMGQGTLTGLAQLVAEELGCDWSKVTTEYPSPGQNLARNRVWGNFSTGGSRGIRESHDAVRKGGAAARLMLVQAAAHGWGVPAADCTAAASVISHPASGRRIRYGQVAGAAAKFKPPTEIALKNPKDWTLAGKPLPRLDTVAKTTGAQVYGMDLKLPGMLSAAIADCPVVGGKLRSFDAATVMKMPGVKAVVPVGDSAVAVVANTWWRAKTALAALKIDWDEGPNATLSSAGIDALLKAGLDAPEAIIGAQAGQAKEALAAAARTLEAVYAHPYQHHATMEVMNATAKFTPAAAGQAVLRGLDADPQQIEAQVEGSFAYGLSAAMFGEITVEAGRIQQSNFHDYPALLMAQMPKVETIVMPSGGFWGGVGEPTIAVAAPAVLNAIFAATGQRIRTLPIKQQNLKRA